MTPHSHAFGPDRRLGGKADFDRVFATATVRLRRHSFLLLAAPGLSADSRLGLVIGKRHARRAVARNRIRRQARETFRTQTFRQPYDIVLLARPGAGECSRESLAESLRDLWHRLEQQPVDGPREAGGGSPEQPRAPLAD